MKNNTGTSKEILSKGIPSLVNADFEKNDHEILKQVVNFVIDRSMTNTARKSRTKLNYGLYNQTEITDEFKKTIDYLLNPYAKGENRVPFKRYLLARSKINRLKGEFLELPLKATVSSTNPETIRKKVQQMREIKGMSILKNELEHLRTMGIPVFKGVNILPPDQNPLFSSGKFQAKSEILSQTILDKKIEETKIKTSFVDNMVDMVLMAEVHGKVEVGLDGRSNYRPIDSDDSIFIEMDKDPLTQRSFAWGECQRMLFHEIVLAYNLSRDDQERIAGSIDNGKWSQRDYFVSNDDLTINVYTIETFRVVPIVTKVSKNKGSEVPYRAEISYEYYMENKKDLDKQVVKGDISIEVHYVDEPWEVVRIGSDFYPRIEKKKNAIITSRDGGYVNFYSDYVNYLTPSKKGKRVSIFDLMIELDKMYDILRWKVNVEISHYIGSVYHYDEAYLPKRYSSAVELMQALVQDRLITTNSSEEGNRAEQDGKNIGFQVLTYGDSSHILNLIYVGNALEQTMDEIVGFTKPRMGQTNAGTTNANAQIDLMASKVATYDIFFSMSEFVEEVLTRLLEKTRMNIDNESFGKNGLIFDSDDKEFLSATRDMLMEEMGIKMTDGRKEQTIKEVVQQLAVNDISQGNLRSQDVADFLLTDSLASGINVLRQAWAEITGVKMQQQQMDLQSKQQQMGTNVQMAREDREDRQAHDINLAVVKETLKNNTAVNVAQVKGFVESQLAMLGGAIDAAKETDIANQQQQQQQPQPAM